MRNPLLTAADRFVTGPGVSAMSDEKNKRVKNGCFISFCLFLASGAAILLTAWHMMALVTT